MPQTPKATFNFKNLNVQPSVPLLGVVNMVARTTKGPFEDPSELIASPSQFTRMFGSEIVPDGSVSNIMKALEMGAKVRVTRVAGNGATYGWAMPITLPEDGTDEPGVVARAVPSVAVPNGASVLAIVISDPSGAENSLTMRMAIRTREAGSPVLDDTGINLDRPFYLKLNVSTEPTLRASIAQYGARDEATGLPTYDSLLAETLLFSAVSATASGNATTPSINVDTFQNFIENAPNITLEAIPGKSGDGTGTMSELPTGIQTMEDILSILRQFSNWNSSIMIGKTEGGNTEEDEVTDKNIYMECHEGTSGTTPTADEWYSAYEASKTYYEAYSVILSHIHQHLPDDYTKVYSKVADDVHRIFEYELYVEVPKYSPGTRTPATVDETLSALKNLVQTIGPKKEVAYFGGGIKYYNENGSLQKCDVLGSVAGLDATCASIFGPWYSFSGMNRGVIASALGPVMKNLGGPADVDKLNEFAQWYMNLFVIKNTRVQGQRTMLWHGFTSNPIDDSEKFLSIVRLNLYLKKNLRPIMESYLEEPNTFDTWKRIYYEAKELLDDLQSKNAITSYTWLGDQDATSYDELQVNNEADVRQGKYHVQLKYSEVVPMQDIQTDVIIDVAVNKSTGEISISAA